MISAHCLRCNAEILKADAPIIVDGKKQYPSYELDGRTRHICKEKEPKGKFPPRKPRETFGINASVFADGEERIVYWISREGFLNELPAIETFKSMEEIIRKQLPKKDSVDLTKK